MEGLSYVNGSEIHKDSYSSFLCIGDFKTESQHPPAKIAFFGEEKSFNLQTLPAVLSEVCYVKNFFKMQSIQGQEWSRCTEGKSVFAQDYTPVSSVNDRTETWVLGIHSVRRNATPFLVI